MFRTILRYLETSITHINNLLLYAFDLVAENNGVFLFSLWLKVVKHSGAMTLLYSYHCETIFF